jgi:superfamily I DNA/RNA helicase
MPSLAATLAASKTAPPHLIVEALAGTGKTTTLIEGLKPLVGGASELTPSPQQAAVWDSIALSKGAASINFCAFNSSIAKELQARVPVGVSAMTMHSMGNRAITAAFGKLNVNEWRVADNIARALGKDIRDLRAKEFDLLRNTDRLVGLCKQNLVTVTTQDEVEARVEWYELLDGLASHYDVELNGSRDRVYSLVPKIMEMSKDVDADRRIDFNDMIWLPVVLDMAVPKYDLLLVDECQDLNRGQQALALKAGRRLVFCGDKQQAIYGFAGADAKSMERLEEELGATAQGCQILPLTVTRRCGRAIVNEAKKIVPLFEAHESNCEGSIKTVAYNVDESQAEVKGAYHEMVENGDMILCRVNAPLVSQCFRFLRSGRKANIQGRDIGKGLISTVNKMRASDIPDLIEKLSDWQHRESEKELRKRLPNENRLITLQDRYNCLLMFTEGVDTISEVISRIEGVFTDERHGVGIKLSTIHRAKGLESHRVFLLEPPGSGVPHPSAKSKWQIEQEYNLRYVAITRAISELVFVK